MSRPRLTGCTAVILHAPAVACGGRMLSNHAATVVVATLLALTAIAVMAPTAAADHIPDAHCTLSYPGTCTVSWNGVRVICSGIGDVPDCRI